MHTRLFYVTEVCDITFLCLPSSSQPSPPTSFSSVSLRVTEQATAFFYLQKRRGHGETKGFAAKFLGTLDNIRDAKPLPYRILLHTESSDFSYVVAVASTSEEISTDWKWLKENMFNVLGRVQCSSLNSLTTDTPSHTLTHPLPHPHTLH